MSSKLSLHGLSADAVALTAVKLMTMAVSLVVTRVLSQFLSMYDYGTYSQILLIASTVASLTIFGMMDGMNYFFCSEEDEEKRESYVATIYMLQCGLSAAAGLLVFLLRYPICGYLGNRSAVKLMFFAAAMPIFQNLVSITQVLIMSIGRARLLAARNLIVSIVKFLVVLAVIKMGKTIGWILMASMLIDIIQIIWFVRILDRSGCRINVLEADRKLLGSIFKYCAPMAVFTMLNALTRDTDKYIIALFTNTEQLAVYSNASKILPFDIIMASFTTVLMPVITRAIARKENDKAVSVYRKFLEVAYISTTILAASALVSAPELMELLYSKKYLAGFNVFVIYIMVDIIRFTNITLILSAAGRTMLLMKISMAVVLSNIALSVAFFRWMGVTGPAAATLVIMLAAGLAILHFSAGSLGVKLKDFFDVGYLLKFTVGIIIVMIPLIFLRTRLEQAGIHYLITLVTVSAIYALATTGLNFKRLMKNISELGELPRN